jgi:hypothetical protein
MSHNRYTPKELIAALRRQAAMRNATWPCVLLKDILVLCDENERLQEALAKHEAESPSASLRAFARDVLGDWPVACGLDGFDIQELAVKHGLLVETTQTKPCDGVCTCSEYFDHDEFADGVTCYRRTDLLSS